MAQDDGYFDCGFRFLSHEANSALQALRAQYEVRLIETRHAVEQDGWVMTESGRRISHAAQIRLVDVLIEMVETLYEKAGQAYFCAVGSSEYKERVDLVERQLLGYAMERWAQLTRGLPLEPVDFDPVAGAVLRSNEELLSATLAAHVRSKALKLELQMWQTEVVAQSGELASGNLQSDPGASGPVTGDHQGVARGAMAHHELPRTSAERVRAEIDKADLWLTNRIKWLPTELQDGKKTREEVEAILCQESKDWAWSVFVTILREWAAIGIPPDDFEAIAKDQTENLSTHAEERVAAFVEGSHLTSGNVLQSLRQLLPRLIRPYREENRFRFESLSARPTPRPQSSAESILAQPSLAAVANIRSATNSTALTSADLTEIEQKLDLWRDGISVDITLLLSWSGWLEKAIPPESMEYFRGLPEDLRKRSFLNLAFDWEGSGTEILSRDQITDTLLKNLHRALKRYAQQAITLIASKWVDKGIHPKAFAARMESAGEAIKHEMFEMLKDGVSALAHGASTDSVEQALSEQVRNDTAREIELYRRNAQLVGLSELPERDDVVVECRANDPAAATWTRVDQPQPAILTRPGKARKGDATLLGQKQFVSFKTAEQYLGISERQRQKLMNSGALKVEGQGHNRKITTESLKACLPLEIPN